MQRNRVLRFALLCLALLSGCARVNPAPFSQFADNLRSLRDGVDAQAQHDYDTSRERFVQQVLAKKVNVADLQLGFPADQEFGFEYSFGEEPLFVKLGRYQSGLKSLNDALVSYADLLVMLAGDKTLSQSEFDQLAQDLNANAAGAVKTLKLQIPADRQALLSTVAIKIFQSIIERKRRKKLTEAIMEVQPQVQAFSTQVQNAIRFLATGVKTAYDDQFLAAATPTNGQQPNLDNILKLNQQTEDTLRTLAALRDAYAQLPAAHNALGSAANEKPGALGGLIDFTNETLRLRDLYNKLKAQNP